MKGSFLEAARTSFSVAVPATGKTHFGHSHRPAKRSGMAPAGARFFNLVDLAQPPGAGEACRQGRDRSPTSCGRTDIVVLDGVGYLPFPA